MEHLGDKLKEYRKGKDWNQDQMATFLKIGYRTYQKIESTGNVAKADDMKKIQDKTGINTQKYSHIPESQDPIKIIADLSKVIGELQEEMAKLNARVTVATTTLALSVSNQTGKPIAYVSSEIAESIDKETDRLLAELKKKQKKSH